MGWGRKSRCKVGLAPLRAVLGEGEGFPCSERPIHGARISRDGEKHLGDWKETELVTPLPAQVPLSLLATSFSFFSYIFYFSNFILFFYSSLLFSFFFVAFSLLVTRLAGS